MNGGSRRTIAGALLAVAVIAAAGGGYWFGARSGHQSVSASAPAPLPAGERKVLYYRHPMGLPDTSPTPKKDPMGMDYVAVYEGDDKPPSDQQAADNTVAITPDRMQKLGVSFATVERGSFVRPVRAVGRIDIDERRRIAVAPKFEGWIEVLHVNTTGQAVQRGQPLLDVYSPELVSAQREYLLAQQSLAKVAGSDAESGMQKLAEASLVRLRNWDITDEDLRMLVNSGTPARRLTLRAPAGGTVLEKPAVQGMRFMPGEMLFKIADLSTVWVLADVFEQELALVKIGQMASVQVNAYPGRRFPGRVSYIYPTVNAETRTAQVRIELANPAMLLKPSMYAEVEIAAGEKANVLMIPPGAALTTGTRSVVLVARDVGRFEPREIELGMRSDKQVEVVRGLKEGERVVASANFLIDAESNLRSALGAIGGHGGGGHGAPAPVAGGASKATPKSEHEGANHGGASTAAGQVPGAVAPVRHSGEGTVTQIDAKQLQITLSHDAIPSLKWPAMEMPFAVRSAAVLAGVKPGQRVSFELEAKGSEYVVTRVALVAAAPATGHTGH